MAGWASNSKYAFLGAPALRGADGVLRGLDRLRDHHGAALRRLAEPERHRAGAAGRRLLLVRDRPAAADVRHLLHLGAGRDQPLAVRPAGRRVGAGRRLLRRILVDDLRAVLPRRVREHDPDERR